MTLPFSPLARIPLNEKSLFNGGYQFLQQICGEFIFCSDAGLGGQDNLFLSFGNRSYIITCSPKCKTYQQKSRAGQIECAIKTIHSPDKSRNEKDSNNPSHFIQKTCITYDDFYAVITNLKGNIKEIISINKNHWEIEENMKITGNKVFGAIFTDSFNFI